MISRAILIALFALSGLVFAQSIPAQQNKNDDIKVTAFPNGVFKLNWHGLVRNISLQGEIGGCTSGSYDGSDPKSKPSGGAAITRVIDLMFRDRTKDSPAYLTFQTTLGSGCNVQGRCGAASAVTVVWLELDPNLKVVSKRAVIVQECLTDTSLMQWVGKTGDEILDANEPKFRLRAGKLEIVFETEDLTKKQKVVSVLRYFKDTPAKGLIVSSKTFATK